MASGSFSNYFISGNDYYALIVDWSSTPTTSSNSSVVKATVKLKVYSLNINARTDNYVTINGKTYYFDSAAINRSSPGTITLGTVTSSAIAHNSDGSKSITIKAGFKLQATISGTYYGTVTASKSVTLDKIPRAATLDSAPNFTDEGNPVIKYSNPAGSAVTTLRACISTDGSTDDLAAYRDISKTGSSYTFNLTSAERTALRNACANAKSMTVYFYVMTVLGGETYRSRLAKTLTITNAAPTLSPTVVDGNSTTKALTGDSSKFVKGYSDAAFTVGASAKKGATIKSTRVTCGAISSTASSGTLQDVLSAKFVVTATDSRGYTATQTLTKTLIDYVKLSCKMDVGSPTADGKMVLVLSGNYFNGSFGAVTNTLTLQYRVSTDGGSTWGGWQAVTATKSGSTYTATVNITGLDYRTAYTFQAQAVDRLRTVTTAAQTVKALPVFEWGADKFVHNTNLYMAENGYGGGMIYGVLPDGQTFVGNVQPVSESGNCVIGWGNYDRGAGNTHLYAGDTVDMFIDGVSDHVFRARNTNGHMLINKGGYDDANSDTYLYGNDVGVRTNGSLLVTSPDAGLSSRAYGVNKVLWSGEWYMSGTQTATLSEAISAQPHGIVLLWSAYSGGAAQNNTFLAHFVPKHFATYNGSGGYGMNFPMFTTKFGRMASKYLYVSDTTLKGHADNTYTYDGTEYDVANNNWVLRNVIGV